jgi:hypothetical protein
MRVSVALMAAALLISAAHAVPGERDRLNACKAMVEHAGPAPAAGATPESTELQKCRQIIKEWTLRDSRMSLDENGRPLR